MGGVQCNLQLQSTIMRAFGEMTEIYNGWLACLAIGKGAPNGIQDCNEAVAVADSIFSG